MFQELRRFLSIDRNDVCPRPSNQTTPSQNRHINSLPTELLIMIFQNYCCFIYSPVSLSLVCRFWHAIVTACPALWNFIGFQRCKQHQYSCGTNELSICYRNWSNLERALTRAETATLSLAFHLCDRLHSRDDEEGRVLRLFGRCRDLRISLENVVWYTFASSIIMPHLEHLELDIDEHAHIEPLLDSIESNSPQLSSLCIFGSFPANLAQREPLLRRLVRLDLLSPPENTSFFRGLQNLEELGIEFSRNNTIELSLLDLPKLVSLYLGATLLPSNQQPMTFPALESLTLDGKWSNLQFITAPKLRNIVLINQDREESEWITVSALRRSTVCPLSLSIDFISDTSLPALLGLWSNLSELHLEYWGNACIPGPITTTALAGSRHAAPLCPSLRYLTVHMHQHQKDLKLANISIRRLTRIVKKRKGNALFNLQRVMCVWEDRMGSKKVEWVDVL